MARFSEQEIRHTYARYVATRDRVEAGELAWDALADFFTDGATFIDPAWGRIEGIAAIRKFLNESMLGLDGWTFPHEFTTVHEDRLLARWQNRLPGKRADGSYYEAPGYSLMTYAGNGKFSFEEDLLNMVHVAELIRESGWKPQGAFHTPPRQPKR
jgi:ketosteroid isomerase-like protein